MKQNETQLEHLIQAVNGQKVHQIKCGAHHFVDITIVQTDGRFFVRQYKFNKRSWYQAFINNPSPEGEPNGAMKVGNLEVLVNGKAPDDLPMVTARVNKAYRKLLGLIYPVMLLTFDRKSTKHQR